MNETLGAIADHYDFLLPFYRLLWGEHIHHGLFLRGNESPRLAQEQMIAHCFERAHIAEGARILDVGCGLGGTAIYLAAKRGCHVTGLTLSRRQAIQARRNAEKAGVGTQVDFQVVDAEEFDFPAAAYDAAWIMESSEHFCDKAAFFPRMKLALKPAGKLLLAAWTGNMQNARVAAVARWGLCPEIWSARQYAEAISAAGFRITMQEDLTEQVEPTWEIVIRRARWLWPIIKLMPRRHREFAQALSLIRDAYAAGDLSYTVMVAQNDRA